MLALVELELWPNLIRAAKRAGAKVAIINARLSSRSYRGYRSLRAPLQPTLGRIDAVAAQNGEYARRFVDLGIPGQRVSVTGSVKYDGLESDRNNGKTRELRQLLGLAPTDLVFVAGSTMEGEEAAVLAAYRAARRQHSSLRLILVPRHAERFERVAHWLEQQGETVVRRSQVTTRFRREPGVRADHPDRHDRRAVGGLGPGRRGVRGGKPAAGRGGQNMMEPAAYGASVMFGPHVANFRETVDQLLERNAARQVADADELTRGLLADLDDPEAAAMQRRRRPELRPGPERCRRPDPGRARPPRRIFTCQADRATNGLRFQWSTLK